MENIVNMNVVGFQAALREIAGKNNMTREQAAERYPELAGQAFPKDFGPNTAFGIRNAEKIVQQRKDAIQ
jgi:hypothetical protein